MEKLSEPVRGAAPGEQRRLIARLCALLLPAAPAPRNLSMSEELADDYAGPGPDDAELERAVRAYQSAFADWQAAPPGPDAEPLRERVRLSMYALWPLLSAALAPVARGWTVGLQLDLPSAGWSAAVEDAITSLCIEVADQIPRLAIRPGDNLAGLLRTIARRRAIDSYRRFSRARDIRPAPAPAPDAPPAEPQRWRTLSLDEAALQSCAEALGHEFEEAVVERAYRRDLAAHILAFCRAHAPPEELLILRERFLRDPPTPHEDIARALGPPWNSPLVRARLSRVLKRIRDHLAASGLIVEG